MVHATAHKKKVGHLRQQVPTVVPTPEKENEDMTIIAPTAEAVHSGLHPSFCEPGRCRHLDAASDRAWAVDPEPYFVDVDGSRSRMLTTRPVILDPDVDLAVHIAEFEATGDGAGEAPIIVLTASTDEFCERRLTADEARALAGALLDHARALDHIEGVEDKVIAG